MEEKVSLKFHVDQKYRLYIYAAAPWGLGWLLTRQINHFDVKKKKRRLLA